VNYEVVIGLEVHAELATRSKMFCGCPAVFGGQPNTQVCPVCLGLPGVLPVPNRRAVEFAIRAALALNCAVASVTRFDRKNYFYPDLPKAYQISQYQHPLAKGGYVGIATPAGPKRVTIQRLHLEEDTGKLLHLPGGDSLVDLNRAGVPLMEIVSEPELSSPQEARDYLMQLKAVLEYTGVSDVRMEEGSLRCDVNVSLRPAGSAELGNLVEVKNLNSFRAVQRALEHEVERQRALLEANRRVVRETRHWDEASGTTFATRSKEEAHDYRYFPEPDLLPLEISPEWVEQIRSQLPELPGKRRRRLVDEDGLPEHDAAVLTASKRMADLYDACRAGYPDPKTVSNWLMGELARLLNATGRDLSQVPLTAEHLIGMWRLMDQGVLSGKLAKAVFEEMFRTGKDAATVVREQGASQISDEAQLAAVVERVVAANPKVVADFRGGKEQALGFLVGQVMRETRGRANPELANRLLRDQLRPG
jgi:aspartyl-tRNA(Asn)/glutamyl-tRNA(Gln) amidotransferase subunit B